MNRIAHYYDGIRPRGDIDEPSERAKVNAALDRREALELRWAAEVDRRIAERKLADARRTYRSATIVFLAAAIAFVAALMAR